MPSIFLFSLTLLKIFNDTVFSFPKSVWQKETWEKQTTMTSHNFNLRWLWNHFEEGMGLILLLIPSGLNIL